MADFTKTLEEVKKNSKQRQFKQTIDLIVNLQQMEFSKAENRFTEEVVLDTGKGKDIKIGVIGDDLAIKTKNLAHVVINEMRLDGFEKNKKDLKQITKSCDFFIADPKLMLKVGKVMGRVLGPKGKMPKPVPPQMDPTPLINKLKKTVKVRLTGSPTIQVPIGTEDMSSDQIGKNVEAVLHALEKKLPNGKNNIKEVLVKTTMGKPIKVAY